MDLSLYDQLQNPVLAVNSSSEVVYFNFICSTYFKMPPRKLKKVTSLKELIQTDQADLDALIKETLEQDTSHFTKEVMVKAGENPNNAAVILKFIPIDKNTVAVHLLDFSIERQLHEKYKKQILELKETHEQIVKSDKLTALGELISGISHEIATPLTILSNRLERMEAALIAKDLEFANDLIPELKQEYARVTQIISGMQSYARNQEEELQICDLGQIANDSVDFIRGLGVLHDIELVSEIKSSHLAMANPLKLQQVFINLMKNSVDALREVDKDKKQITISIDERDYDQLHVITVSDNGPGIPDENRDKVFEMFYTSKELGEGTGLGLNISQKIVEAHNGRIEVADVDSGCQFDIEIPIVEVGSFTHTNRYLRGESEIEDEKVLVIGDDIELLNKLYKVLKDKNKVCIFSRKAERLQELADFFMIDRAIKLKECDLSFLEAPIFDLSGLDEMSVLDKVEADF